MVLLQAPFHSSLVAPLIFVLIVGAGLASPSNQPIVLQSSDIVAPTVTLAKAVDQGYDLNGARVYGGFPTAVILDFSEDLDDDSIPSTPSDFTVSGNAIKTLTIVSKKTSTDPYRLKLEVLFSPPTQPTRHSHM